MDEIAGIVTTLRSNGWIIISPGRAPAGLRGLDWSDLKRLRRRSRWNPFDLQAAGKLIRAGYTAIMPEVGPPGSGTIRGDN